MADKQPVLVVGPSMAGKTRLVVEVLKEDWGDVPLFFPASPDLLNEFLTSPVKIQPGSVVFLDDIDRFFAAGLNCTDIDRLLDKDCVIVATMMQSVYDEMAPTEGIKPPSWDVTNRFAPSFLNARPSPGELQAMRSTPYADLAPQAAETGLPTILGGAPKLRERYASGAQGPTLGWALVRAAVDWRRAGLDSASGEQLQQMVEAYPDGVPGARHWTQAWEWAKREFSESVALLVQEPDERWTAHDVIVDDSDQPIPVEVLATMAGQDLDDDQCLSLAGYLYVVNSDHWMPTIEHLLDVALVATDGRISSRAALLRGAFLVLADKELPRAGKLLERAYQSDVGEGMLNAVLVLYLDNGGDAEPLRELLSQVTSSGSAEPYIVLRFADWLDDIAKDTEAATQRYEQALEKYTAQIDAASGDDPTPALREKVAEALVRKGYTLGRLGRFEQQIAVYDQVITTYQDDTTPEQRENVATALLNKCDTLNQLGRYEPALAVYDQVITTYQDDPTPEQRDKVATALVNKGDTLRKLGRYEPALAVYDQVITTYQDDTTPELRDKVATALVNKGVSLSRLGRDEPALVVYDRVITTYQDGSSPEQRESVAAALVNKGVSLSQLGRGEPALAVFDRVVTTYQDDTTPEQRENVATALLNKGGILNLLGRDEPALAAYDQVITTYQDDTTPEQREIVATALLNKGGTLGELGRFEQRIDVFDQVITTYQDDPTPALRDKVAAALINKGITLSQLGRDEPALAAYDQVITTYQDDPTPEQREIVAAALINKGITLSRLGRDEPALAAYDQVITTYQDDHASEQREIVAAALVNKGVTLNRLGRDESAIDAYQRSLEIDPDSAVALSHWAQLAFAHGDDGLGTAKALRALQLAGNDPKLATIRAEANFYLYAHRPATSAATGLALQELLSKGVSTGGWSFQPNITRLREHDDPRADLIECLAQALANGDPTALDAYDEWRDLQHLPPSIPDSALPGAAEQGPRSRPI